MLELRVVGGDHDGLRPVERHVKRLCSDWRMRIVPSDVSQLALRVGFSHKIGI